MLYTQEDTVTPRHSDRVPGSSPMRKKIRNITYSDAINLSQSSGLDFNPQSLLMSQDSNSSHVSSSQDVSDKLGQLRVATQDDFMMGTAEDSLPTFDKFAYPSLPSVKQPQRNQKNVSTLKRITTIEPEMEITLRPIHNNPFLNRESHPVEQYFQKYFYIPKRPLKLWIGAYKERSRYISDFEELTILGEGTFSSVHSVRHRIDGTLYAIKKLKEYIKSDNHYNLVLREICALSMLRHCPHMIQYYGSWIDDHQVYIQMELCHLGTLEDMISSIPSKCSIFRVLNSPHNNNSNNNNNVVTNLSPQDRNRSDSYVSENNSIVATRANSIGPNAGGFFPSTTSSALGGSFYNTSIRGISEEFAWFLLQTLAEALEYMHHFHMVHLDIRPANIFIQSAHDLVFFPETAAADVGGGSNNNNNVADPTPSNNPIASTTTNGAAGAATNGGVAAGASLGTNGTSSSSSSSSLSATTTSLFTNVLKHATTGLSLGRNNSSAFTSSTGSSKHNTSNTFSSSRNGSSKSNKHTPTNATNTISNNTNNNNSNNTNSSMDTTKNNSNKIPPPQGAVASASEEHDIRADVEKSILLGEYCLKLGDLGHARHLQEHIPIIEGETRYCPRELIDLETSNVDLRQCDIFSLGMSVYELCLGRFLGSQGEGSTEWHNIRDGELDESFHNKYSETLISLIKQMLSSHPLSRPTASMIRQQAIKALHALQHTLPLPSMSPMFRQIKTRKATVAASSESSEASGLYTWQPSQQQQQHQFNFLGGGPLSSTATTANNSENNSFDGGNNNATNLSVSLIPPPLLSATSTASTHPNNNNNNNNNTNSLMLQTGSDSEKYFHTPGINSNSGLPPLRHPFISTSSCSANNSANNSNRTTPVPMELSLLPPPNNPNNNHNNSNKDASMPFYPQSVTILPSSSSHLVEQLTDENERLQQQVHMLLKQVQVLKSVIANNNNGSSNNNNNTNTNNNYSATLITPNNNNNNHHNIPLPPALSIPPRVGIAAAASSSSSSDGTSSSNTDSNHIISSMSDHNNSLVYTPTPRLSSHELLDTV